MAFIYIDESGDLGMSCKECEYFIITAVKVNNEETDIALKRIPKRIRGRKLKKKLREASELKFSNCSEKIRTAVLKMAAKIDIEVFCIAINKHMASGKLKENLPVLYNYLIKSLLEKVLPTINSRTKLRIHLDKCMSFSQQQTFENYIKTEFFAVFRDIPLVQIEHEDSAKNAALQVADFICGAFGYKYNTSRLKEGCDKYTDIIKTKIKLEKTDLFR